jgi:hypothetical protein
MMRRQFVGIDLFEDFEIFVVFWGYDGLQVRLGVIWFCKSGVDFLQWQGKLFNFTIPVVGVIDDVSEGGGRNSADCHSLCHSHSARVFHPFLSMKKFFAGEVG